LILQLMFTMSMDHEIKTLGTACKMFSVGDCSLDSDCSTMSSLPSIHEQLLHSYRNGVYSGEAKSDQDSNGASDIDTDTTTPLFIYGGLVPGSVFLSFSSPSFLQSTYQKPSFSEQPEDIDVQPAQKKHTRPCKEKRERFRKVIDHLKVKVRQERENFDVDHIPLPKGLATDSKAVARVKSMMGHYRDQVLAGVDVPDLDAQVFNMRTKQAYKVLQALDMEVSLRDLVGAQQEHRLVA